MAFQPSITSYPLQMGNYLPIAFGVPLCPEGPKPGRSRIRISPYSEYGLIRMRHGGTYLVHWTNCGDILFECLTS
jgi:hypothetical protein